MKIRRISELKRSQAQLLDEFRADRAAAISESSDAIEPASSSALAVGRIESVVSSDAELGAHLVVTRQKASGVPVGFGDDSVASQVYYPGPGSVVGDYAIDEYVLCCVVDGARIALKMA